MTTYTKRLNEILDNSGNIELSKLDLRLMHMTESDFGIDGSNNLVHDGQTLSGTYAFGYDGTDWVPLDASTANMGTVATKTYVDNKINDLVGNAPSALNTLGKIKELMNSDPSYAYNARDVLSKQRLQVFEGDGIKDQFCIAAPWLPVSKACMPPKADKVDVYLNGVKLKSQITDPNNRDANLTTGYDYRLFGESPEYSYFDLRANPNMFTEEYGANYNDITAWPMDFGAPAIWMGGMYTPAYNQAGYPTSGTHWNTAQFNTFGSLVESGVSFYVPAYWALNLHPFMNVGTYENPIFRKRTKLHFGAYGKMYNKGKTNWTSLEDRQKLYDFHYSDWSWFRDGDIVEGKTLGVDGPGTGSIINFNNTGDTMTAFTHFYNWNGDMDRLTNTGTYEFSTSDNGGFVMNYVAHLQQSVDYHKEFNPNPGPFRYEGWMPTQGTRNPTGGGATGPGSGTGSLDSITTMNSENPAWPDNTVHITKYNGGWGSSGGGVNQHYPTYTGTESVGGIPVGTVYYDDGMLDWGGFRNFQYAGGEVNYSGQTYYGYQARQSTLDMEYCHGGGENGGYTRVHRLTPRVDKNDYVYGIRLAPHLAPLAEGDKLIVRTY